MQTKVATRHLLHGQQEFVFGKVVALLREDETMASRVLLMVEPGQFAIFGEFPIAGHHGVR